MCYQFTIPIYTDEDKSDEENRRIENEKLLFDQVMKEITDVEKEESCNDFVSFWFYMGGWKYEYFIILFNHIQ